MTPIAFYHVKPCLISSTPHTCCGSFSLHRTKSQLCFTPPSTHSRASSLEEQCLNSQPEFWVGIWFNSQLLNTESLDKLKPRPGLLCHKTRWQYHWRPLCFAAFLLPPRPSFFKTENKACSAGLKLQKFLFFFFLWLELLVKEDT